MSDYNNWQRNGYSRRASENHRNARWQHDVAKDAFRYWYALPIAFVVGALIVAAL